MFSYPDGQHSVHHNLGELFRHVGVHLGGHQDTLLLLWGDLDLHVVQYGESFLLGLLVPFRDDPRMKTLGNEEVDLLKELADKENYGRCSIASHIILKAQT